MSTFSATSWKREVAVIRVGWLGRRADSPLGARGRRRGRQAWPCTVRRWIHLKGGIYRLFLCTTGLFPGASAIESDTSGNGGLGGCVNRIVMHHRTGCEKMGACVI